MTNTHFVSPRDGAIVSNVIVNIAIGRVGFRGSQCALYYFVLHEIYLHTTIYVIRIGIDRVISFVCNS